MANTTDLTVIRDRLLSAMEIGKLAINKRYAKYENALDEGTAIPSMNILQIGSTVDSRYTEIKRVQIGLLITTGYASLNNIKEEVETATTITELDQLEAKYKTQMANIQAQVTESFPEIGESPDDD